MNSAGTTVSTPSILSAHPLPRAVGGVGWGGGSALRRVTFTKQLLGSTLSFLSSPGWAALPNFLQKTLTKLLQNFPKSLRGRGGAGVASRPPGSPATTSAPSLTVALTRATARRTTFPEARALCGR